jgi:hypothetical protein
MYAVGSATADGGLLMHGMNISRHFVSWARAIG